MGKNTTEGEIKITANKTKAVGNKKVAVIAMVISFFVSSIFGALAGYLGANIIGKHSDTAALPSATGEINKSAISSEQIKIVQEESAIIDAVKKVNPLVVSIIVTKDLPKIERYYINPFDDFFSSPFDFGIPREKQNGTEKQEVGGGTGFIVSSDGVIVTNKHVVEDESAEYTVLMNDEKKYTAKVLARDPSNDIAILKIEEKNLSVAELGDSDVLQVGQIAIAIGNALGEFRNTVSVGVVSGLQRSITAGGGISGAAEQLSNIIQTDAAINPGNSGGPLLNSSGQVVGVNVAIAQGAQSIGFAIPINDVKKVISDVQEYGRIIRPYLGIRYIQVTKELAKQNKLSVDYGALIVRGENAGELAVIPGSPADKAGLVENDIILEVDKIKLDEKNSLVNIIRKYNAGDELKLKVLHKGEEKTIKVKLEEMK